MKYLSQVVGAEKNVRKTTDRKLTAAYHALQKPDMMVGVERIYQPIVDGGQQLPQEGNTVQATVKEMIEATRAALIALFDVTAARDFTNGPGGEGAVGDVLVDGEILVAAAPVPYLIWLDKQLEYLGAFVAKMPTLSPETTWTLDDPRGVYRSLPVQTLRMEQQPRALIVVPATDKFPAQATTYQDAVAVGTWTVTKLSGAIHVEDRSRIADRIQDLRIAVAEAREDANRTEAQKPRVGEAILDYIFA